MKSWDRNNPLAAFMRKRRRQARLTQMQLASISGLGLRFIREVEQGKDALRMDKVNQLLLFFGHELAPQPISDEKRKSLWALGG